MNISPPQNRYLRVRFAEKLGWQVAAAQTDPQDPSMPARRHFVRVQKVEHTTDPLFLDTANNLIAITRIQWEEAQALPFEMCLLDLSVHGNIVPATAGETMTEFFVIGRNQAIVAAPKIRDDQGNEAEVHTAVERQDRSMTSPASAA